MSIGVTALVLADTHLRTGSPRWLPDRVVAELRRVDVVLHAGDVLDAGVLDRVGSEAGAGRAPVPVHAVLGNNDLSLTAAVPHRKVVDLGGVRIGLIHDSGRSAGREARLHRMFPDCRVVVFGHSHEPMAATGVAGQLLFNPGSPTQRRRQPFATFGLLRIEDGAVKEHAILPA
jgi:putative phosphoesterase